MKIGDLCQVRSGTSFSQKVKNVENGDFWVMESKCANSDGSIELSELTFASLQQIPMPNNWLTNQSILIRGKGGSNQALLFEDTGKEVPIFATSYFLILTLKDTTNTSAKFLTWLINQPEYQEQLKSLTSGTTVQHLTKKKFLNFELTLPTLDKQRQLRELAKLMVQEKQLVKKLEKLRQEYYQLSISIFMDPKNG